MTESSLAGRRDRLERNAAALFIGTALTMAIVCGAIIVAGWFAGVIEDHAERVFWAGAILALLAVFVLGAAAFPGGENDERVARRITVLTRVGLVMFISAPTLCIGALIADFYG